MFSTRASNTKLNLAIAAVTGVAVAALAVPTVSAGAAPTKQATGTATVTADQSVARISSNKGRLTSKVRGEFGSNGIVRGTFHPDRFFVKHGETFASGVLHAKLKRANGNVIGTADRRITIPVKNANSSKTARATCDILNLVLGPLDLNLLGLEVHLKKVVLDIVARTGAGNLLGNLLCAVAGLLDGPQLRLSNVLNRILSILRA
jgi:hypothetical protein